MVKRREHSANPQVVLLVLLLEGGDCSNATKSKRRLNARKYGDLDLLGAGLHMHVAVGMQGLRPYFGSPSSPYPRAFVPLSRDLGSSAKHDNKGQQSRSTWTWYIPHRSIRSGKYICLSLIHI